MSFIPAHFALAGFQPEDDIDTLFHQLPQIEPSGEVVTRILARIRHMPGLLWQQETPEKREPGHGRVDTLVIRNERHDPS